MAARCLRYAVQAVRPWTKAPPRFIDDAACSLWFVGADIRIRANVNTVDKKKNETFVIYLLCGPSLSITHNLQTTIFAGPLEEYRTL